MSNRNKIHRVSGILRVVVTVFFVVLPVGLALYWVFMPSAAEHIVGGTLGGKLSFIEKSLGYFSSMIPTAVFMFALWQLRRLFGLYMAGSIFTPDNVECYRRLGLAAVLWVPANILSGSLGSVLLTYSQGEGNRQLSVGISSAELESLFIGLVVLLISWVMDEGRKMEEEQALTV